jgi:hypothetical protein
MGPWSTRQLAALGAVAATVIFVIGFLLPGSPPKFNADALKVIGFFHDKHKKVLVSTVLVELGIAVTIGIVAQLAVLLRDAGHRSHAAVVGIAGAASLASLGVGLALYGGLGQLATFRQEAGAVAPLYRLVLFTQVAWFWATFVMVVALALAAWKGAFPMWVAPVNGVIAVLLVLGGVSVKAKGVFSAGTGTFCVIGSVAFLVWVLHLAALFWERPKPAAAPMSTPA